MKKIIIPIVLILIMSLGVFSWGATRTVSGNTVTVIIDGSGVTGNPNLAFTSVQFILEETASGTTTIESLPSGCGIDTNKKVLKCDFEYNIPKTGSITDPTSKTFTYLTAGDGEISGTISGGYPSTEKNVNPLATAVPVAAPLNCNPGFEEVNGECCIPNNPDFCCDQQTNTCCDAQIISTTWVIDQDGDGYKAPQGFKEEQCTQPAGYIDETNSLGIDCDDTNVAINSGADEICGDDLDNNCDGIMDSADPNCISTSPSQTIGEKIDKDLTASGIDPKSKSWTIEIISKLASIFKNWFG